MNLIGVDKVHICADKGNGTSCCTPFSENVEINSLFLHNKKYWNFCNIGILAFEAKPVENHLFNAPALENHLYVCGSRGCSEVEQVLWPQGSYFSE